MTYACRHRHASTAQCGSGSGGVSWKDWGLIKPTCCLTTIRARNDTDCAIRGHYASSRKREDDEFIDECADPLYHLPALISSRGPTLRNVVRQPEPRHLGKSCRARNTIT